MYTLYILCMPYNNNNFTIILYVLYVLDLLCVLHVLYVHMYALHVLCVLRVPYKYILCGLKTSNSNYLGVHTWLVHTRG